LRVLRRKKKRRGNRQPPAAARGRPPPWSPLPWLAVRGRSTRPPPVPGSTQPGSQRPFDLQRSAATGEGRGGTLPPRCPPAHARASSGTRVRRLSPGTHSACDRGPPSPPSCPRWLPDRGGRPAGARSAPRAGRGWQPGRWPARQRPAPRVSLRRSPSPSGGLALTQELCGSTLRALHGGRKDRKGTGGGRAAPLTVARGLPRGEAAQGGSAELPHGAGRSGKAAYL